MSVMILILTSLPLMMVQGLNLSWMESVLLQSRLSSIQQSILSKSTFSKSDPKCRHDVFIFPGAGGRDALTDELEERISNQGTESSLSSWVTTVDWKEHRGSVLTAAFDAEAVGEAWAQLWKNQFLLQSHDNESHSEVVVHCIGISVGAFAANAMAKTLFESSFHDDKDSSRRPRIRLTLLDPFCGRGIWGFGYGANEFGRHADFAEQYLNTDDPVPTTNDPLPFCYCVNVTNAPERSSFQLPKGESMHCWPLAYYARYGYQPSFLWNVLQHTDEYQRGMVVNQQS